MNIYYINNREMEIGHEVRKLFINGKGVFLLTSNFEEFMTTNAQK